MPKQKWMEVVLDGDEVRRAAVRYAMEELEDEIPDGWVVRKATWRNAHQLDLIIGPEDEA